MELNVAQPNLIPPGAGEIVGDAPDRRVEIVSDCDSLHATWSRFGPGREGADLHVHHRRTDFFFVLAGELTLRLGPEGRPAVVPAGTLARVPPLVVHGFRNGSDADVRYLNLHAPGEGFADFMRALRDGRTLAYDQHPPPADGGRPPSEVVIGDGKLIADRPGLRVALLADVEAIAIEETWWDPDGPPPPTRPHRDQVESFYVLEGEIEFTVGERGLRAEAGSWVQISPGVPYAFTFAGEAPVHFLSLRTPSR